jgi:hypothetical protein
MNMLTSWTGRTACALQSALRLSNEAFAAQLGIGVRTVAGWHQKPALRPRSEMQQLLDTTLAQAEPAVRARFAALTGNPVGADPGTVDDNAAADAERRLDNDPNISQACETLDQDAGWQPGTARREVASRLVRLDTRILKDRASWRERIGWQRTAEAMHDYYRNSLEGSGCYAARYDKSDILTSILVQRDWLDLAFPLDAVHDRLTLTNAASDYHLSLDKEGAGAAAQRLAETLLTGTVLVDRPLYRLHDVSIGNDGLSGGVEVIPFARYALTMDLLESELLDALAADVSPRPGALPLRDRYLPDTSCVITVADRLCAGGTVALTAIARPASPYRGPADYLLLVQERSGDVLNAARRLTVLPRGFHQPMTDFQADARIGATLRREMEEELFGREDIDNTLSEKYAAEPMHPTRLSDPVRWLMSEPCRLRTECTAFGLNLINGNYAFACLIVIDDEDFWSRYGGLITGNWESSALRQYSSLNSGSLGALIQDPTWNHEGLFTLLQGLRRLKQIGGSRVNLPAIEWELQ